MNFINKIILITAVGIINLVHAQKIDNKAKGILDAVSANYKSKNTLYFKFSYGTGSGKISKNQTGSFYASKDKYKLKIMGNEQIFDGNKTYSINEDEQEITIAKQNSKETLSPINYIDSYKKGYNIYYTGKNKNLDIIKLTPTKNNGIKEVFLYVNTSKNNVEKIEQYSTDKHITTITITEYKENPKVDSKIFTFNKNLYKNYLITEL
ncbi:MAG: outer membrane lipoprotein carrier protein LolA [Riemerella sp.]|nr:MAG: outer membrane lipoprotein carrier protein LolA [Riemerella sp.]